MKRLNENNLFLLIAIFLLTACAPSKPDENKVSQSTGLTILGLDGCTWEIIDPLIARGELPGFQQLKKQGSWGPLKTYVPTESVSIWTSIATGMSPTNHGVQTFTRRIPGTDSHVPSPGTDRQVPAIWNVASKNNKTVVTAKWFATWPAEEVNGAMLSPRLEAADAEPRTYPPELFHEIDHFRYESTMDQLPQPPKRKHKPAPVKNLASPPPGAPPMLIGQDQVKETMFDDTTVWKAAQFTYNKYNPDLYMVYLKSTDRVEHFLWGAHTVDNPTREQQAEAEAIYGWYRYFDGLILELLQDPERTLMVVSDHGMNARTNIENPYYIWDLDFDRILSLVGKLKTNGHSTNWSQTQCYTYRMMPYDKTVLFRLNLKEREPGGIIAPEQKLQTVEEMIQTISNIKTDSGSPLFQSVENGNQEYDFKAVLNTAVSLEESLKIDNNIVKLRDLIVRKGLPRGIHTDAPPGIIAVIGPEIEPGKRIEDATVFDVTPTALKILGLPVAKDLDGSVLTRVFKTDYLKQAPIQFVETFGTRNNQTELSVTGGDERMLDELRALGYIN